jgi:hypothetical protein
MDVEASTPRRRFRDCRIFYPRPWRIPTLVSYPPPPPSRASGEPVARPAEPPAPEPRPRLAPLSNERPAAGSASRARRRDCVFLPNMDVALQFLEARRLVARVAEAERPAGVPEPVGPALAVGLMMLVAPPVAVTLVWSMPQFGRTARIALTLYAAVVTIVAGLVVSRAF